MKRFEGPYSHAYAFLSHPFSLMRSFGGDITHVQAFFDKPEYGTAQMILCGR